MALSAGPRTLSRRLFSPRAVIGWSGALAVGLAATGATIRSFHGAGSLVASHAGSPHARWSGPLTRQTNSRHSLSRTFIRTLATTVNTPLFSFSSSPHSNMAFDIPQSSLKWDHKPEEVGKLTKELIGKDREVMDKVGGLAEKDCNFESVRVNLSYPLYY
jgi:hypothetical protein